MKSTPKILSMLLSTALTIATFSSCGGDEPADPSGNPEQPGTPDIETLVADNITVSSKFDNPMWSFTITSTLGDQLSGHELEYRLTLSIDTREASFSLSNLEQNDRQSYTESYAGGKHTLILNTPFYEIHTAIQQINAGQYVNCRSWHDTLIDLAQKTESDWDEYDHMYYDTATTKLAEEADALKAMKATVTLRITQSNPSKTHTFTLYKSPLSDFLHPE